MKNNIQEIYKILNLPDVFTRLEMDTSQLKPIEHLLTPFLNDCQNNSPTLGEMIVLAKKYDGVLDCYIVNSDRNDTRFSCEGIFFPDISRKDIIAIVSKYPDADEMNVDDNNLRLWWD